MAPFNPAEKQKDNKIEFHEETGIKVFENIN